MTKVSLAQVGTSYPEELVVYAEELCQQRLAAYRTAPHDAEEHANIETSVLAGGYAYRQVAELIQNAADAIADIGVSDAGNRIVVEADERGLWCANTGLPLDASGVRALLNSHASGKRAGQIGRFGLGFKSLLRLGGTIDVFSRTVCLHFDPARSRSAIRSHLGLRPGAPAPGLRLAEPGTWDEEITTAPGADRFRWASTVVFAELRAPGARSAVTAEIQAFPSEFLLFLPCDVELELRTPDSVRRLRRLTSADDTVVIEDLANERRAPQQWRVFETTVEITSQEAKEDATAVHSRDSVPLIWAAPIGGVREAGRFFAFFPTTTETRTLGILNAPWKLNSDRTSVIPGAWNAALMQSAAELIVANVSKLATPDDPGAVLDAFPRDLITANEPAAPLVNALWALLAERPILPNCDQEAVHPARLWRAPLENPELIAAWSQLASPEACESFLHPTCTATTARTGRLRQLAERLSPGGQSSDDFPRLRTAAALEWLQQIATADPGSAPDALRFADRYAATVTGWSWDQVRDSIRLILTATGSLVAAPEATLAGEADPPLQPVHPVLRSPADLTNILRHRFHLQNGEDTDWERLLIAWLERASHHEDAWAEVWKILRRMTWDEFTVQAGRHTIFVRTLAGWHPADEVIVPGALITIEDVKDVADQDRREQLKRMLLDTDFHASDTSFLVELDITEFPALRWSTAYQPETGSLADHWLRDWEKASGSAYHESLKRRPDRQLLGPEDYRLPASWQLLLLSPDRCRPRVTARFLRTLAESALSDFAPVLFRHCSRPQTWATMAFCHPFIALLKKGGVLTNSHERIAIADVLSPETTSIFSLIPSLSEHMVGLTALYTAFSVFPPTEIRAPWSACLRYAGGEDIEPQTLAAFFEAAAKEDRVPRHVCTPDGPLLISEVRMTGSHHEIALARSAGITALCLSSAASTLWMAAGARSLDKEATLDWVSESDENPTVLLLDLEPSLRDVLKLGVAGTASAVMPALMERAIGGHRSAVDWTVEKGHLLIAQNAMSENPWPVRVRILIEAAKACGWIDDDNALDKILTSGVSARRRLVAAEPSLPARLLRATGGSQALLSLYEDDVREMLRADPDRMARVTLTLYGPSLLTLPMVRHAMQEQGLEPPERWGTDAAADYIAAIGFPPEYAISPAERREAELAISGPLPLKPLHDFQAEVVASLKLLIGDSESRRRRAVISLPTGAGKTRVAAETAVREILSPQSANRLVLWIAQSDELCEQAVQCFRELWSNIGASGETLRLIRFWGGQINPSPASRGEPAVIVASIQTLTSRMNDPALSWASRPGLIVIDECHHALTPAYSVMLRWLSPDAMHDDREPPIVGLSATPFRGRSEEETKLLASRFDNRLLPGQQAELFGLLQSRGVLAEFSYTALVMNERFLLSSEEEKHLEKFNQLNETALRRLGENAQRNDRILDAIAALKRKSTLAFATSVEHAHRLAARLNVMGISAATITGETDRASRRWFIQAFQRGEVSVLCNHSALTTGFDAPATDLIVIARPVFSPALYMQMVGRGLRGPANGGKETCHIITVQDNLDAYTGKLAHNYFEQYYVPPGAVSREAS